MKRSVHVSAPLLAAAALGILAGCRKPDMQRCVDEQNRVVNDSFCNSGGAVHGSGGGYYPYRYYYGGGGSYAPGSIVSGGGYAPIGGRSYASSTSRGGFGSSHGGGEGGGEGGGHGGGGGGE